jgi:hypothetical protein
MPWPRDSYKLRVPARAEPIRAQLSRRPRKCILLLSIKFSRFTINYSGVREFDLNSGASNFGQPVAWRNAPRPPASISQTKVSAVDYYSYLKVYSRLIMY